MWSGFNYASVRVQVRDIPANFMKWDEVEELCKIIGLVDKSTDISEV